jgi:hypothetical protein
MVDNAFAIRHIGPKTFRHNQLAPIESRHLPPNTSSGLLSKSFIQVLSEFSALPEDRLPRVVEAYAAHNEAEVTPTVIRCDFQSCIIENQCRSMRQPRVHGQQAALVYRC